MNRQSFNRKLTGAVLVGIIVLCSASCVQGPDYLRPPVETPADWAHIASGHSTTVASDKMPEADWWQSFHNQELT
ncbi:MAG: hypothetical protein M3M98_08580, partial [Nitrospirota bacterium]|nr:hypothetical protein [Nitrospirota bacterium]